MSFLQRHQRWILFTFALAVIFHLVTIIQLPNLIMGVVMDRLAERNGINTLIHGAPIDANSRVVVSPSPDLLYSICLFDLSDTDVHLTSPVPQDGYWSVSMFDANTNTFYVRNNVNDRGGDVDVLLVSPNGSAPVAETEVVQAPTDRGLILFRRLIEDRDRLPDYDAFRRLAECSAVAR